MILYFPEQTSLTPAAVVVVKAKVPLVLAVLVELEAGGMVVKLEKVRLGRPIQAVAQVVLVTEEINKALLAVLVLLLLDDQQPKALQI